MKPLKIIAVFVGFVLFLTIVVGVIKIANIPFPGINNRVKGDGNIVMKEHVYTGFTSVEVNGSARVKLVQGDECMVRVRTDSNLHQYIKIYQSGDNLVIGTKRGAWLRGDILVTVTAPELRGLTVNGAGSVRAEDPIETDYFKLRVNGAADAEVWIKCRSFEADLKGAGNISLKGKAENATFRISGAGEFHGKSFKTEKSRVRIRGAGEASIYASEELDIDVSGAGEVTYYGNPSVSKRVRGAGDIHQGD